MYGNEMSIHRMKRRIEHRNHKNHPLNLFPDDKIIEITNEWIERVKNDTGKLYIKDVCDTVLDTLGKDIHARTPGNITSIKGRVNFYLKNLGYSVIYRTSHTTIWDVSH